MYNKLINNINKKINRCLRANFDLNKKIIRREIIIDYKTIISFLLSERIISRNIYMYFLYKINQFIHYKG